MRYFYSKARGFILLQRFHAKRWFYGFPWTQLRPHKDEFLWRDLWNFTPYPDYSKLKKSFTVWTTNLPTKLFQSEWLTFSQSLFMAYNWTSKIAWTIYNSALLVYPFARWCLNVFRRSIGDGALYIKGMVILFAVDAALTDDEPLWEPVEWSLVQSWILFIFAFAWIGENLIGSRYGGYTGRDKRVWTAWYKTFWLIEGWYLISMASAALFVITPFYHEITYTLPLVVSWWNWYSRVFFFKFISLYSLVLYLGYYLQLNVGTFHWKKSFALIILINMFLSYLLYTHFMMCFFGYFTDPNWYHKTRLVDYVQLSHEPHKWSWGSAKRDHFSYHKSTTVFWFKSDGPFAGALLFFHMMFLLFLFAMYFYWLSLLRRTYATQEVTFTYTTFCVSALRQFFYFILMLYGLVFFSFIVSYWRLPIEYLWVGAYPSWTATVFSIVQDYPSFLLSIIF